MVARRSAQRTDPQARTAERQPHPPTRHVASRPSMSVSPSNGSRLSCGRLARQGTTQPLPLERERPPASSAPLKAQSARGRTALWGRGAVPLIRKGVGLLLPLTSHSTANDLHAPLRALTAPELPSEGGGPLVLPASRETTRRTPPLESGAPPAGVAAGASRHSSALPSSSNRRSSRACAPPPRSHSASPWPAATARTGCAPGQAAASASAPLRRTAT